MTLEEAYEIYVLQFGDPLRASNPNTPLGWDPGELELLSQLAKAYDGPTKATIPFFYALQERAKFLFKGEYYDPRRQDQEAGQVGSQ